MAWTTPTIVEICIGLEINGYLPAESEQYRRPRLAAGTLIVIVF